MRRRVVHVARPPEKGGRPRGRGAGATHSFFRGGGRPTGPLAFDDTRLTLEACDERDATEPVADGSGAPPGGCDGGAPLGALCGAHAFLGAGAGVLHARLALGAADSDGWGGVSAAWGGLASVGAPTAAAATAVGVGCTDCGEGGSDDDAASSLGGASLSLSGGAVTGGGGEKRTGGSGSSDAATPAEADEALVAICFAPSSSARSSVSSCVSALSRWLRSRAAAKLCSRSSRISSASDEPELCRRFFSAAAAARIFFSSACICWSRSLSRWTRSSSWR